MHVAIVSNCKHKAWKRTRALLDSYAMRIGQRTWATPITMEGLNELKSQLRKIASRQTAVACYRNDRSADKMSLMWIIGSRNGFGESGHFPVAYTKVKKRPPEWVLKASVLAQMAGLMHDAGKSCNFFSDKLKQAVSNKNNAKSADPVRHEWVSLKILQSILSNNDPDLCWQEIKKSNEMRKIDSANNSKKLTIDGVCDYKTLLEYAVATHHKLFGQPKQITLPNHTLHINDEGKIKDINKSGDISEKIYEQFNLLRKRLHKKDLPKQPQYWKALSYYVRNALILADHFVSSIDKTSNVQQEIKKGKLFANTKEGRYNQPLDWHLQQVANTASQMLWRIWSLKLPALSEHSNEQITADVRTHPRFNWQNTAAQSLISLKEKLPDSPTLVFNVASTGAGKTIANARLAALCSPHRPRFSIALNLRSLTQQTTKALKEFFCLTDDEVAMVMGDKGVRIDESNKSEAFYQQNTEKKQNEESEFNEIEYITQGENFSDLAPWLEHFTKNKKSLKKIFNAPILISTIDYLVNAGEPGKQGHHAMAFLQCSQSDLVLDEIDSYEPESLAAVLRLIQITALAGRSVICSSATLPTPVATAIFKAYSSGIEMNQSLKEVSKTQFGVVICDNHVKPTAFISNTDVNEFLTRFKKHQNKMLLRISEQKTCKKAYVECLASETEEGFHQAIKNAVSILHKNNLWKYKEGTVSFGLVRVANIKTAISVANYLADTMQNTRIACYHSQMLNIQRYMLEKKLDNILNRKQSNNNILKNEEIQNIISSSANNDVSFIVVATPVEEIGRDHDFDWAVIEPSSAHSIIQVAGRVNRHRLITIKKENIAILQKNLRAIKYPDQASFIRPGVEGSSSKHRYSSNDMCVLLQDSNLSKLDARIRLDSSSIIGKDEDRILTNRLHEPLQIIQSCNGAKAIWMNQGFYNKYSLRGTVNSQQYRAIRNNNGTWIYQKLVLSARKNEVVWQDIEIKKNNLEKKNTWLTESMDDLFWYCAYNNINKNAFELSIPLYNDKDTLVMDINFGFYMKKVS